MKRAAVLLLILVALAGPAFALFPDPVELSLLGQILTAVDTIDSWLADVDQVLSSTKSLMQDVWPSSSLQGIGYVFAEARSIRSEISSLACGWNFSVRVQKLWDGLFNGIPFCKPEFNLVYGPPPTSYNQDLEEAYDWSSTLTITQVSDWMSSSDSDEAGARWLLSEAMKGQVSGDPNSPYGPGYSQRLSAVAAAQLAKELHELGDLDAAELRNTLLRSNEARLKARKQMDLVITAYALAANETPFQDASSAAGPGGGE